MKLLEKCVAECGRNDLQDLLLTAGQAALAGGAVLKSLYGRPHQIKHKGEIDLVTEADVAAEEAVLKRLRKNEPSFAILAEESHAEYDAVPEGPVWIVDPLDGTTNFAHNFPWFGVSVGLFANGKSQVGAIYAPATDEFFCAARGEGAWLNGKKIEVSNAPSLNQALLATGFPYNVHENSKPVIKVLEAFLVRSQGIRRPGAAALDLAYLACGRLDGFWEINLKPWDTAAGVLLVEEAGGRLTDFSGKEYSPFMNELLASNGHIHSEMVGVLKSVL
jgi:myo-inositol-1(or 4)-monophosphatase